MNARLLLMTLLGLTLCISCSKDKDEEGVYSDSYFYVSIDGPSVSGEYRIDVDDDISQLETTGAIAPSNDPLLPDALLITYHDYEDMDVNLIIPAQERLTELLENAEFGLAIRIGDILLHSKSVSIHLTHLKKSSFGLPGFEQPEAAIANFEGVMIYTNQMGQDEAHTVSGDFKFFQRF